jgi:hypothetical protein
VRRAIWWFLAAVFAASLCAPAATAKRSSALNTVSIPGIHNVEGPLVVAPDGQRLLVVGTSDGSPTAAVFAIPPDGSHPVKLTTGSDKGTFGAIRMTADGSRAVIPLQRGKSMRYLLVSTDGSARTAVDLPTGLQVEREFFSSAGVLYVWAYRLIKVKGVNDKTVTPGGLSVILRASPGSTQFRVARSFVRNRWVAVSAAADQAEQDTLGECGAQDRRLLLGLLDPVGGSIRYIRTGAGFVAAVGGESDCAISANGQTIAVTARGPNNTVYLVVEHGGKLRLIRLRMGVGPHDGVNLRIASISRDGSRVYMYGGGEPGEKGGPQAARVVDVRTGRIRLAKNPLMSAFGDALTGDESPTGSYLAGISYRATGSVAVRLTNTGTFRFKEIVTSPAGVYGTMWTPDGSHLIVEDGTDAHLPTAIRPDGTHLVHLDPGHAIDWLQSRNLGTDAFIADTSKVWFISSAHDVLFSTPLAGFGETTLAP